MLVAACEDAVGVDLVDAFDGLVGGRGEGLAQPWGETPPPPCALDGALEQVAHVEDAHAALAEDTEERRLLAHGAARQPAHEEGVARRAISEERKMLSPMVSTMAARRRAASELTPRAGPSRPVPRRDLSAGQKQ